MGRESRKKNVRELIRASRALEESLSQEEKAASWSVIAWTPFKQVSNEATRVIGALDGTQAVFVNSRYQVTVIQFATPFGECARLSIKTHDKMPRHDWRDLQRIKNEICGPERWAVEIYPAESRLVDSANQYWLYVFERWVPPFGFGERLVGDGNWNGSIQRPFVDRPADCMASEEYDAVVHQRFRDDPFTLATERATRQMTRDAAGVIVQHDSVRQYNSISSSGGDGDGNETTSEV
jgi:hypothetical protein